MRQAVVRRRQVDVTGTDSATVQLSLWLEISASCT